MREQMPRKETDFSQVGYVIFDWDGTLVDSREAYTLAFTRLLQQKFAVEPEEARKYYQATFGNSLGAQFQEAALRFAHSQIQNTSELESFFWDQVKQEPTYLLPGAAETLQKLRQAGYKIAIWTNARADVLEFKLREFGLEGFIDFKISEVVGSRDEVKGLVLFARIAQHFGVTPQFLAGRTIVVGDGERDMQAANLVGAAGVGVLGSKTAEQLKNAGAQLTIIQLFDLWKILEK